MMDKGLDIYGRKPYTDDPVRPDRGEFWTILQSSRDGPAREWLSRNFLDHNTETEGNGSYQIYNRGDAIRFSNLSKAMEFKLLGFTVDLPFRRILEEVPPGWDPSLTVDLTKQTEYVSAFNFLEANFGDWWMDRWRCLGSAWRIIFRDPADALLFKMQGF